MRTQNGFAKPTPHRTISFLLFCVTVNEDMPRNIVLLAWLFAYSAFAAPIPPPPSTPAGNTVDVVQGMKVADLYRWLENAADPRVETWSDAQNARTRSYLDGLP